MPACRAIARMGALSRAGSLPAALFRIGRLGCAAVGKWLPATQRLGWVAGWLVTHTSVDTHKLTYCSAYEALQVHNGQ